MNTASEKTNTAPEKTIHHRYGYNRYSHPRHHSMPNSGISWALASGIPAVDAARFGGTSVTMLERVYRHLLVSSAETARARMDESLVAGEQAPVDDAGSS